MQSGRQAGRQARREAGKEGGREDEREGGREGGERRLSDSQQTQSPAQFHTFTYVPVSISAYLKNTFKVPLREALGACDTDYTVFQS